ncbi:MAG: hypothetical protein Fur006_64980 [Coleofasciculaceae cyanobacterium]
MGIEASYRRITPEEFERLHSDADYANIYFGYDLETDEEIYAYFEALEASDRYLDLDKHWRALHFLLTGAFPYESHSTDESLFHKVFWGGATTQWEATYGMVRYLTVSEVKEIAEALRLILMANLEATRQWWDTRRVQFTLYISQVVLDEVARGDTEMATRRLEILRDFPLLEVSEAVQNLAVQFLAKSNLPPKAADDALHIAAATVYGLDYLLT